jgi:hypothetical protein
VSAESAKSAGAYRAFSTAGNPEVRTWGVAQAVSLRALGAQEDHAIEPEAQARRCFLTSFTAVSILASRSCYQFSKVKLKWRLKVFHNAPHFTVNVIFAKYSVRLPFFIIVSRLPHAMM